MRLARILQFVLSQCWALEPGFHKRMVQLLEGRGDADVDHVAKALAQTYRAPVSVGVGILGGGGGASDCVGIVNPDTWIGGAGGPVAATEPFDARGPGQGMRRERDVAVIPIRGVIAQRASQVDPICSDVGTSVEHIRGDLQAAMADESVKAIVLEVDSPGGSVAGLDDLANDLREARERKPIVAHTDGLMASAAYWLASQADKVFATRDAVVGSIGVIAGFLDNHRKLQQAGVDPVVIKSTPGKGHVQSSGAFGDEQRSTVQAEVDHFHRMFVDAVAAGRRVPAEKAAEMGDGRVRIGSKAETDGFIDAVRPLAAAIKAARQLVRAAAPAATTATLGDSPASEADVAAETTPEAEAAEGNHEAEQETMSTQPTAPATPAPAAATSAQATTVDTTKAERDRCTAINRAAIPEQRDLAAKLIADGTPIEQAQAEINADLKVRLDQAKTLPAAKHEPLARGNTATVAGGQAATPQAEELEGEELWRAEWKKDKALRAEFDAIAARNTQTTIPYRDAEGHEKRRAVTGLDLYIASMRNEGSARVVGSRETTTDANGKLVFKDTIDAVPIA